MRLSVAEGKCFGCHVCEMLCSAETANEINPMKARLRIYGRFPVPGKYDVVVCNQCGVCAEVCPEEAIAEEGGVYRIDEAKCTGCRVCVDACPSHAMFLHDSSPVPFKCVACGQCTEYCTRQAITLVRRKE